MRGHMALGIAERKRPGAGSGGPGRRRQGRAAAWVALASLLLAGCSGTQSTVSSTIRPLTDAAGFSTHVEQPKEFVTATRPATTDYLAVGVTPPDRKQTVLTPAELAKATEQLDATRSAHDKLAGRKPPVQKSKAAVPPKVKKPDEKPVPSL